jgi:hypothetical protein
MFRCVFKVVHRVKLRLVVDLIAESYCSLLELLLKCGHLLCATDFFGVSWISLVMSSMWMVCAFHPSLGIFSEIWTVLCSDVFSRLWLCKLCQCCVQVLRHRYERLRGVYGRIQNELATMGERVQSLLSWRDPRYHFILWQCCPCKYVALWVACI